MARQTSNESVLVKIDGLVHEEEHLYGQNDLADHDQARLASIHYSWQQLLLRLPL